MEIILATQNAGKLKEFNELSKSSGLTFIPIPVEHTFPEETGHTFFENAFIKANYVFSLTGLPSIGDDSGLEVDVLMEGLEFILLGIPEKERTNPMWTNCFWN